MHLKIGISSCPNDTFIFEALYNNRLSTDGISFEWTIADIKELNALAAKGALDIIKVSYYTYAKLQSTYSLLSAGGAIGYACGPLLLANTPLSYEALAQAVIGIPGIDTTAHFLLNFYAPHAQHKKVLLFSEIIPALLAKTIDAGVIIHESRFVYQTTGLHLVQDLGAYWEEKTGFPIPLGCIIMRKDLGVALIQKIDSLILDSLELAFKQPENAMPFIRSQAQELNDEIIQQHINLYVNDFSRSPGEIGKKAIDYFIHTVNANAL